MANSLVESELSTLNSAAKWQGTLTSKDHIPSIGEYQEKISKSHLFLYYSMTCLLHKFPANLVADLSIFSQCKAMVLFDRMNTYKTLIDRNVLTSRHFVPSEQPLQLAELFSLCGLSSITLNHWSTKPEDNFNMMREFLAGTLRDGYYLGASAKRYWTQGEQAIEDLDEGDEKIMDFKKKSRALFRDNLCTYGMPLVRIV